MPNRVTKDAIAGAHATGCVPTADALATQLDRILSSPDFCNSKRLSAFLRYIVNEKLAGREKQIKGYTIAIAVYERDNTFNPDEDPIVRIDAGRMRRALDHYYHTEGKNDPIRIDVPKGGYVPTFEQIEISSYMSDNSNVKELHKQDYQETLPTLLIMPVQYAGVDQEYLFLAKSLSEEFVIAFSRISYLRTISAAMLPEYKDKNNDTLQLALKHNIRFVLATGLNILGRSIRLRIQLFDTKNGEQLWGNHYELPLAQDQDNILQVHDELIRNVVAQVGDMHNGAILQKLVREIRYQPQDFSAYEATLLGYYFDLVLNKEAYIPRLEVLEQAVNVDPDCGACWADLAGFYLDNYIFNFIPDTRESALNKAAEALRRAHALAPTAELTLWVSAGYGMVTRNKTAVLESTTALLDLNPLPSIRGVAGAQIAVAGEWQRGIAILEEQINKLHFYPRWFHWVTFLNAYRQKDYETALIEADKMNTSGNILDPLMHAASLGQLGRTQQARDALKRLLILQVDFTQNPRRYLTRIIMQDELVEHVLEGLYKAGL